MQETALAILSEDSSAKNIGNQDMEGFTSIQSNLRFSTNNCLGTRSSTTGPIQTSARKTESGANVDGFKDQRNAGEMIS